MLNSESANITSFKRWLADHGGGFHPHACFLEVPQGVSVAAREELPCDTKIVTCPFTLAVTAEVSRNALLALLSPPSLVVANQWSARQWICTYICFHWIVESSNLAHAVYLRTLPTPEKLRTPLHFTPLELEMFRGTNMYGATLDRGREWRAEWSQCHVVITDANAEWGLQFSWESYLTAATYLSSRAFPSSLLSPTPSLKSSPSIQPVLLPGIDSLDHARGHPVSWIVSYPDGNNTEMSTETPNISLVLHTPVQPGQGLFNNYGAKPNSELILGYGFSLPKNPDDTIVLKLGGIDGGKWEIGRSAKGAGDLWDEIVRTIVGDSESAPSYEDHLDAAGALIDMIQEVLDRLPADSGSTLRIEMRPEVALMFHDYVEGQRDILESLLEFAREKERLAIESARTQGVGIVLEDELSLFA